jgi:hypothetical protein
MRTTPDTYTENHHVLPKCLGGLNDLSNLVRLTAEEHFVAHQLLVKIHPGNEKLIYAVCFMSYSPTGLRVNNRAYGWLKRRLALIQSKQFLGRVWTDGQNKARSESLKTMWLDPEFKAVRSASMRGRTWSKESRAARSASLLGKPGRVWTAEQKAKMSETKRNRNC